MTHDVEGDEVQFDGRPSIRLDNTMPENPKIVGLSDAAFRLYIEALCWCSRQEEDGIIPEAAIKRLGKARSITELVTAGLLIDAGSEYMVHDYLRHQRSRAEITAFRQSRAERGELGAHKRWHVATRKKSKDCAYCTGEKMAPNA